MNEELNFSQLLKVAKKSFKRALIYVLVSAVLVLAVSFTIRSFKNYTVSTSTISVTEEIGVSYESLNRNKAIAVQRALRDYNPEPDNQDFERDVLNALSISAKTPASINVEEETVFVPTSFTLSLNGDNLSSLTDDELNTVLTSITEKLLASLSIATLEKLEISTNLENGLLVMEYFQLADDLYYQASKVYKSIESQLNINDNLFAYKAKDGYTLNNVLNDIEATLLKLNSLKTDIIINRIENIDKLQSVLTIKRDNCKFNFDAYKTMADSAYKALESFPKGVDASSSSSTTVVINTEAYKALAEEYTSLLRLQADAKAELDKYESYLTAYASTSVDPAKVETYKTYTENALTDAYNDLQTALSSYRDIVKDYNDNHYASSVEITKAAYTITQNSFSTTSIILITAVVAIVAYLVAFIQAYVGVNKESAMKKTAEEK